MCPMTRYQQRTGNAITSNSEGGVRINWNPLECSSALPTPNTVSYNDNKSEKLPHIRTLNDIPRNLPENVRVSAVPSPHRGQSSTWKPQGKLCQQSCESEPKLTNTGDVTTSGPRKSLGGGGEVCGRYEGSKTWHTTLSPLSVPSLWVYTSGMDLSFSSTVGCCIWLG
jgi:hypothetical protein